MLLVTPVLFFMTRRNVDREKKGPLRFHRQKKWLFVVQNRYNQPKTSSVGYCLWFFPAWLTALIRLCQTTRSRVCMVPIGECFASPMLSIVNWRWNLAWGLWFKLTACSFNVIFFMVARDLCCVSQPLSLSVYTLTVSCPSKVKWPKNIYICS